MDRYRRKIEAAGNVRSVAILALTVSGLLIVLTAWLAFKGAYVPHHRLRQIHWPGGNLVVWLVMLFIAALGVKGTAERAMYRWMEHSDNLHDMQSLGFHGKRASSYARVYRRLDR